MKNPSKKKKQHKHVDIQQIKDLLTGSFNHFSRTSFGIDKWPFSFIWHSFICGARGWVWSLISAFSWNFGCMRPICPLPCFHSCNTNFMRATNKTRRKGNIFKKYFNTVTVLGGPPTICLWHLLLQTGTQWDSWSQRTLRCGNLPAAHSSGPEEPWRVIKDEKGGFLSINTLGGSKQTTKISKYEDKHVKLRAFSKTPSYIVRCCTTSTWPFNDDTLAKAASKMFFSVCGAANHCAPSCLSLSNFMSFSSYWYGDLRCSSSWVSLALSSCKKNKNVIR